MNEVIKLRKHLNRSPELSGFEMDTGIIIKEFIKGFCPDVLFTDLEGGSFLASKKGASLEDIVILRCDIDAVSGPAGKPAHLCGHDGHAAAGAAAAVRAMGDKLDAAVLFQCSEENGKGAEAAARSMKVKGIMPRVIVGHHNIPGFKKGAVIMKNGVFALASSGISFSFMGEEAHASEPEKAISPFDMMKGLAAVSERERLRHKNSVITMTHFGLGEKNAFGVAPGTGMVNFTVRSNSATEIEDILQALEKKACSERHGGEIRVSSLRIEPFPETVNDGHLYERAMEYLGVSGYDVTVAMRPFLWSEDFGHYRKIAPSLFFGIGAGHGCFPLHHPSYEYPDEILEPTVQILSGIIRLFSDGDRDM